MNSNLFEFAMETNRSENLGPFADTINNAPENAEIQNTGNRY
jgi:hypothetical protein